MNAERSGYRVTRRDRFAHALSNFVLNVFATREYRAFVRAAVSRGLESIEKDLRDAPRGPG